MSKKELKSEINELKKALKTLCGILGISFEKDLFGGGINVGRWSCMYGGDIRKKPIKSDEFDSRMTVMSGGINKLAKELGYEWNEKKTESGWVKSKKK